MNSFLIIIILFFVSLNQPIYPDENMIEDYITKSLEFWNVPGASIAIVKGDKIILAKGYGYTKLDKVESNKVNAETLFPIASLTKSFTSVAGSIFAKEQNINLDAAILSLWPAFKLSDDYATKHLTLLDCLSMRAGLTGPAFEESWWKQAHLTEPNLLESLSKLSFRCGFRGCFAYQNLLYNIIGHTIETKTGKPWGVFVKEQLLDKLEMLSTTIDHASFIASQNKAFPHQWFENTIKEVPFEQLDLIAPGAGLSSNANDMSKWLQFLLDKNSEHATIIKSTLTPQTLAKPDMFFPKEFVWMEKVFFPEAHFLTYGMGWFIHDYKGVVIYQDPGLTDGMNGLMALVPELDLGIVILNNLEAPFFSHSVLFHIIDYYRNETTDWNQILLDICLKH